MQQPLEVSVKQKICRFWRSKNELKLHLQSDFSFLFPEPSTGYFYSTPNRAKPAIWGLHMCLLNPIISDAERDRTSMWSKTSRIHPPLWCWQPMFCPSVSSSWRWVQRFPIWSGQKSSHIVTANVHLGPEIRANSQNSISFKQKL